MLRERFEQKKAAEEQERLATITPRLAEVKTQKEALEKKREELLKGYEELQSAVAAEREERKELQGILGEHSEMLKKEGIESLHELEESPGYAGEPEVKAYKERKSARHEHIAGLKEMKKKIQVELDGGRLEEEGSRARITGKELPPSQKKILAILDQQIAELDREYRELWKQTPEGKEAREKEKQEFADEIFRRLERRQNTVLFQRPEDLTIRRESFFSQEMFARAEELGDVEKHDEALVKEAIAEAEKRIIARGVSHLEAVLKDAEGVTRYGYELTRLRKQAEDLLPAHIDRDWAEAQFSKFEEGNQKAIRRGNEVQGRQEEAEGVLRALVEAKKKTIFQELLSEIVSISENGDVSAKSLNDKIFKLTGEVGGLRKEIQEKESQITQKERTKPKIFGKGKHARELESLKEEKKQHEAESKEKNDRANQLVGDSRAVERLQDLWKNGWNLARTLKGKTFTVSGLFAEIERITKGWQEEKLLPEDEKIYTRYHLLLNERNRTRRRYEEAMEALQSAQAR